MMWQSSSTHEPIRVRDQRIAKMPIAVEREGLTLAQRLEGIAVVAIVAIPFTGYWLGKGSALFVALLLIAGAVTEWVRDRRQP